MNVSLSQVNDAVHFVATNPQGLETHIDGKPAIGGVDAGFRPMQLVLAAVAGCASMDLTVILKKQRAGVEHIEIEVMGEREDRGKTSPFTNIELVFKLYGEVHKSKAERAVQLAVEEYCSVADMLRGSVDIRHSIEYFPSNAVPKDKIRGN